MAFQKSWLSNSLEFRNMIKSGHLLLFTSFGDCKQVIIWFGIAVQFGHMLSKCTITLENIENLQNYCGQSQNFQPQHKMADSFCLRDKGSLSLP